MSKLVRFYIVALKTVRFGTVKKRVVSVVMKCARFA
jgi:hypothetical protein